MRLVSSHVVKFVCWIFICLSCKRNNMHVNSIREDVFEVTRRHYSQELKKEIVNLYNLGWAVTDLSEKYGVSGVSIYRWAKDFPPAKANVDRSSTNFNEIQQENIRLKQEIEILKKAMEIFAKNG